MVALIIVDMQKDFMDEGALPIKGARALIPLINEVIEQLGENCQVIATGDWHLPEHASFARNGGSFPVHCVQNTPGARVVDELQLPMDCIMVYKGQDILSDGYSAFTGECFIEGYGVISLDEALRILEITHLYVCGVATEYCVRATVMDGKRLGYRVSLITNAIAGVDSDTASAAQHEMGKAGVQFYRHGNDTEIL